MPVFSRSLAKFGRSGPLTPASSFSRRFFHATSPFETQTSSELLDALNAERTDRERVLILGSGWAGYSLARRLNHRKYQAVIVSPRSYFAFTPLLASTSVGTLEFRTAIEPIRSRRTRVSFFQGSAFAVDFASRTVSIREVADEPGASLARGEDPSKSELSGRRKHTEKKRDRLFDIEYDKLVVAVGCYNQTFGTPGVKEHALFLKDIGDARRIRHRVLSCFETAALPSTTVEMRKNLLNFAIVGGGPTGIEFSAELHDFISEDLRKIFPDLAQHVKISVYDVAPRVLSMFDENLSKYAMETFHREGISIRTSHHVEELRPGLPKEQQGKPGYYDDHPCLTLKTKEQGEMGVGMVVWSTGLMMNPFIENGLSQPFSLPEHVRTLTTSRDSAKWKIQKHEKTGAVITNDQLRVYLENGEGDNKQRAVLENVFAIGDCATMEGTTYPATAQVASQKAEWLGKRLNKGNLDQSRFTWKDMGIMAYIGNWNAIVQSGGGNISGRAAWLVWRGAYLTKSVSWRNKILIPVYWILNWAFGRDVSKF